MPRWRILVGWEVDDVAYCNYTHEVVTWDDRKREANLRRHGLDFDGCDAVFDHPVLTVEDSRLTYGEQRINLLGWLHARVVHMTYAERGEDLHVISLREATRYEAQKYFQAVSHEL